jgi:hypothetical protein
MGEESKYFYHQHDNVYKKKEISGSEKQPLTCTRQRELFFINQYTDSLAITSGLPVI